MNTSFEYRLASRKALDGKWPLSVAFVFICNLFGAQSLPSIPNFNLQHDLDNLGLWPENLQATSYQGFSIFLIVLAILSIILGSTLRIGLSKYFIALHDGKDPSFKTITEPFSGQFVQAVIAKIVISIIVYIGLFLFIIPGIIALYGLFLTPYLMADDPKLSAIDAIKKSWELMKGKKGKLFVLHLSFLGWFLLSAVLVWTIIAPLAFATYVESAGAAFYLDAVGEPLDKNQPIDIEIKD
ncbi:MAG: DUF975 family protein [Clostridia bacterium]|nr:DUF975 family protein [Clostridia bacterium]